MNTERIWQKAGLLAGVLVGLSGCARVSPETTEAAVAATMAGDPQRPAAGQWLRTELYFATGLVDAADDVGLSEADWQSFLDREVTPRFPDGLTVEDAYGQWRMAGGDRIGRLRSKVLIILHEDTLEKRNSIEEIRAAFKRETGQQSVLRATSPVDVSF